MTAVPTVDEELTPEEAWRPLVDAVLEVLDEIDEEASVEAAAEPLPGIVAALTALNTPRAATAAMAAPTVSRLSMRRAASRACTLRSVP